MEVKLVDQSGSLVPTRIETDDDNLLDDSDDEVSVRGVLADGGSGGLLVNGVAFEVNSRTEYKPASLRVTLVAGMEVKVEGHMQGDILVAKEVETEDGDIEIEARHRAKRQRRQEWQRHFGSGQRPGPGGAYRQQHPAPGQQRIGSQRR